MTLEEKIIAYKQLSQKIEDLEEQKKILSQEIIALMPDKKVDVAGFRAFRYTHLSISIPLEQARHFGATKLEEQVDKERIKELHNEGKQIEGVREITYLVIKAKSANKSFKFH